MTHFNLRIDVEVCPLYTTFDYIAHGQMFVFDLQNTHTVYMKDDETTATNQISGKSLLVARERIVWRATTRLVQAD